MRILHGFAAALAALACTAAQAGAMSDYLEGKLIDHLFRGAAYSAPGTLYIGLSTTACSDSGFGTEVSGGGYARVAVANASAQWAAPSGGNGTTSNINAITFPAPTGNWGQVTHWFIADASSGGNLLWCAALAQAKTINDGDAAPTFNAAALSVQIDN
jgi:hypothetical protein